MIETIEKLIAEIEAELLVEGNLDIILQLQATKHSLLDLREALRI